MIPGSFDYHRPSSLEEATSLLAELGEDAQLIAGGHSLLPMMKLRLALPAHLVDLRDIDALRRTEEEDGELVIGAMVTQSAIVASDSVARHCPILRETALQIADPQVRNLGTIGGNLANGDPGNDMPAVMQALDAVYDLQGPAGVRQVKARDFYSGAFFTAREAGEILCAVRIPIPASGHGWAYAKQKRKVGDYATAAAAVILEMEGDLCIKAAIGLTNLADTPLYAAEAAAALVGTAADANAAETAAMAAMAITAPSADGRGPAEFRTHVAGVMVRRAVASARERAGRRS